MPMSLTLAPDESAITTALGAFLNGIGLICTVPQAAVECVLGQGNRVPEPQGPDYVVTWPLRRDRIATNVDEYQDCTFIGSIADEVMTVSVVTLGAIEAGGPVFGPTVAAGTYVVEQSTGPDGGAGTYSVNIPQNVASGPLAGGTKTITQSISLALQMDVHGPNSSDNAQLISTLLRDEYGVDAFAAIEATGGTVTPLYTSDPKQVPFVNAEKQFEDRYIVEAVLQCDQSVSNVPQQFFDGATITGISVEAAVAG